MPHGLRVDPFTPRPRATPAPPDAGCHPAKRRSPSPSTRLSYSVEWRCQGTATFADAKAGSHLTALFSLQKLLRGTW